MEQSAAEDANVGRCLETGAEKETEFVFALRSWQTSEKFCNVGFLTQPRISQNHPECKNTGMSRHACFNVFHANNTPAGHDVHMTRLEAYV